jgi:hypothetical protein
MNISAVRFAQLIAFISAFTRQARSRIQVNLRLISLIPSYSSALAGTGKSQCNCQDADGQYDTFTHYCCAWQIEHISVWIFNEDHEVCPSPRHSLGLKLISHDVE